MSKQVITLAQLQATLQANPGHTAESILAIYDCPEYAATQHKQ